MRLGDRSGLLIPETAAQCVVAQQGMGLAYVPLSSSSAQQSVRRTQGSLGSRLCESELKIVVMRVATHEPQDPLCNATTPPCDTLASFLKDAFFALAIGAVYC